MIYKNLSYVPSNKRKDVWKHILIPIEKEG
jgi:hypothetical protein